MDTNLPLRDTLRLLFGAEPFFGDATYGAQTPARESLLLTALVSLLEQRDRPLRILEIGSWIGFSALTWAYALACFANGSGSVLCIDPWAAYLSESDAAAKDLYRGMNTLLETGLAYELFQHNAGCGPAGVRIDHIRGAGADILPTLERESFDIVYVDGSHYYDAVKADLLVARQLVVDGGILAGDDLERQLGKDIDEATVRAEIERDYVKARGYHPGVTLAVAEILGSVDAIGRTWFMRRQGNGYTGLDLTPARMIIAPHWPPAMKADARTLLAPAKTGAG